MEAAISSFGVERRLLRDQVRDSILKMVVRSVLEPGEKLNEAELTDTLGVSRTPLREALHSLEYEGVLRAEPGRGYFVRSFSENELEDLLALLPMLECEALRLTGVSEPSTIDALEELNQRMKRALEQGDEEEAMLVASEWHRTLIEGCPNEALLRVIKGERRRLYRYGYLMIRDEGYPDGVLDEHEAMIDVLHEGDVEAACEFLKQHWAHASENIRRWNRSGEL